MRKTSTHACACPLPRLKVVGLDLAAFWRLAGDQRRPRSDGPALRVCTVSISSDDEVLGPGVDESYTLRIDADGGAPRQFSHE